MNITIIYSLINLIKMENYVQKIIKGPAKLNVVHCWKVLAYSNKIYMFCFYTNYFYNDCFKLWHRLRLLLIIVIYVYNPVACNIKILQS
jgi:hypothetical protein